eukprot:Rhum_TRINITY_DN1791_c0_g1::Rhum_TRINITY_DN1791_c0_g1_i1::g.4904::m.4904
MAGGVSPLPNPLLNKETIYVLSTEAGTPVYTLWGSTAEEHRWNVVKQKGAKFEVSNRKTKKTQKQPPDVSAWKRPLKVDATLKLMLEQYLKTHKPDLLGDCLKLLVYYHGHTDLLFADVFRKYGGVWPLEYQLLKLYAERAPAKLSNVPSYLTEFAGREPELLTQLAGIYNNGVPFTAPPPLPPAAADGARERLWTFFAAADPARLPTIDAALAQHAADVPGFLRSLAAEFPAHASVLLPPVSAAFRERVAAFYKANNPDRLASVDAIVDEYGPGKEEVLMRDLHERYNLPYSPPAAAAAPPSPLRTRVEAFFRQHNPAKLASLDEILGAYVGREDQLWSDLHKTYNLPLPEAAGTDIRARVTAFFQKHNPTKLDSIDQILGAYAGRE